MEITKEATYTIKTFKQGNSMCIVIPTYVREQLGLAFGRHYIIKIEVQ